MPFKRKSVTFHKKLTELPPGSFDGSSSPAPITRKPATAPPALQLDPMYLTWLRTVTKAQYPFIVNGTFAQHIYHQNFDQHYNMKHAWHFQRVQERQAAVPPLTDKYGPLGWGSLYDKVTTGAWVKNYREIYRFNGSDEQLLEKIAEAYDQLKRTIAAEEEAEEEAKKYNAHFAHQDGSRPNGRLAEPKWETFTQGCGALVSPTFGPIGGVVSLPPFVSAADGAFEKEEGGWGGRRMREGDGEGVVVAEMGGGFGGGMREGGV